MLLSNKTELVTLVTAINDVASAALSADDAARMGPIFRAYFEEAELNDLRPYAPQDLYGAVMAHLAFAQERPPRTQKVRIYNPDLERHGWQSTHTVIEIVNDDMPFLIDSLAMLLTRRGLALHLLVHPVLAVLRDGAGQLASARRTEGRTLPLESFIHAEIDRISDSNVLAALEAELSLILLDIRRVVEDEPKMRVVLKSLCAELAGVDGATEEAAYLEWMSKNNFVLFGFCEYDLVQKSGQNALRIVKDSGLGILRDQGSKEYSSSFEQLPQDVKARASEPQRLVLNKSHSRSTIHRSAHLDYVAVKKFDAKGRVVGERRILGLYTATAYHASPKEIPIIRQKIADVMTTCDFIDESYKAKTLNFVLETYPRDELFEIPSDMLATFAAGMVSLQERPRVRAFVRADLYHRYASCLVYLPRDALSQDMRLKIDTLLMQSFNGAEIEFSVSVADANLARVHYLVRVRDSKLPEYDIEAIELEIARITRGWVEELHQYLIEAHGEEHGNRLFVQYRDAFPLAYREEFSARNAVLDIAIMERLNTENSMAIKLYKTFQQSSSAHHLKGFRLGSPVSLSTSLPVMENMGVKVIDERPYRIARLDGAALWINDFGLEIATADAIEHDEVRDRFQELLLMVAAGRVENDGFNKLALLAELDWREISLVRALAKYLRQAGLTFSMSYMEQCLANYPDITGKLVSLFKARHDPQHADDELANALRAEIQHALEGVANIDEDKILTGLLTVIEACIRTSFFQKGADGQWKAQMAFKLESGKIPLLPQPRPLFEIWVYSPRLEGVHLRGSKVARGGLRWSDRMEDFRTEVLGLVKAQMVKNSVIVPMGSKGGFVCKQLPAPSERDAWMAEGVACYKTFISALLDLTDNIVNGAIVPPQQVRRLDEDDPYLVVAADKGTATFSDFANGISAEYGFWLGDAFASGGSAGYDHKKMAITARGAWESVKRNFRHLGVDTQSQDFTVIGIGDMAGDVFGNGMLLSEHIKLVAAFNHQHIFLDPNPDPVAGFAERTRLFNLPRSSWTDYNAALISQGGGIFERKAKIIPLSPEVQAWLETDRASMAPNELLHAILKARADLLYNGGIGTYIKASTQSHAEVNDRANDALRVDGRDLRVRVVGEGGNLGCTQLGRIEFALLGGRIASDAIDNSAGVDCSDHEVNIKILLGAVIQAGDMTLKQRNVLLAEMTEDIGHLVLRNNYLQTELLAINATHAASMLNAQARLMTAMEKSGELNRALEYLPSEEQIAERRVARLGLAAPEMSVLMAYSKISLDQALLKTDLPDDPDFETILVNYFPQALQQRFGAQMKQHRLKREIIANQLANYMVNRMGTTFVFRLQEESSLSVGDIGRAWWASNQVFAGEALWRAIEALDAKISADLQMVLMVHVRTLIERGTRWIVRSRRAYATVGQAIESYRKPVAELMTVLPELLPAEATPLIAQWEMRLREANVPEDLLKVLARLDSVVSLLDVIELAREHNVPLATTARTYFTLSQVLGIDWLRDAVTRLPRDNRWQSLARSALRDDLYQVHRKLTAAALSNADESEGAYAETWLASKPTELDVCQQMLGELRAYQALDLAMLSAGMRELANHLMA